MYSKPQTHGKNVFWQFFGNFMTNVNTTTLLAGYIHTVDTSFLRSTISSKLNFANCV